MTLDQIETFLKVVECGSFKSASEVLHRSQPALSIAVKKLEEDLGVKLFDRDQYRPVLTAAGSAFHNKALDLFKSAQSLEKFGRQLGLGEEPEISIAIDMLCPISTVLNTLRIFSKEHPDTRLNLSFEVLGGTADKIESGKVQLAISPGVGLDLDKVTRQSFGTVPMVPVVSSLLVGDIPGSSITIDDLKKYPQIVVKDSSLRSSHRTFGVLSGGRQWSVHEMGVKKEIILSGLGWGRIPEHMITNELSTGLLLEVDNDKVRREDVDIFLLRSDQHPMGPLSEELWELFSKS